VVFHRCGIKYCEILYASVAIGSSGDCLLRVNSP
jgi:hypothetical protein